MPRGNETPVLLHEGLKFYKMTRCRVTRRKFDANSRQLGTRVNEKIKILNDYQGNTSLFINIMHMHGQMGVYMIWSVSCLLILSWPKLGVYANFHANATMLQGSKVVVAWRVVLSFLILACCRLSKRKMVDIIAPN